MKNFFVSTSSCLNDKEIMYMQRDMLKNKSCFHSSLQIKIRFVPELSGNAQANLGSSNPCTGLDRS